MMSTSCRIDDDQRGLIAKCGIVKNNEGRSVGEGRDGGEH